MKNSKYKLKLISFGCQSMKSLTETLFRCSLNLPIILLGQQGQQSQQQMNQKGQKLVSLDDALGVLMAGFLRGGVGFLKGTGEIIKGSSGVNRDVRVGVTHVGSLIYL